MANFKENPKKRKNSASSRDIALERLDFYDSPKPKKKEDKIKGRPKSFFVRAWESVVPLKQDSTIEKLRKVVLIAAVIVFIGTLIVLFSQLMGMDDGADLNDSLADIAGSPMGTVEVNVEVDTDPFSTNATTLAPETTEPVEETEEIDVTPVINTPLSIDFAALQAINPDTRGWVKITGTRVNNVVVQSEDNNYYIDHDFYGQESISGTIFSSNKNKWDGTDENIILFGHNMLSGEFFASVRSYVPRDWSREPCSFYKVHPTVMLATPNGGSETYKVFAGILVNTQEQYGEVFRYTGKTSFKGKDDFNQFILDVMDRSWFFTDVDITYGDQLLTLSTCYWPLGEQVDTRWVLFARKVRPGESEFVDTTVATRNYQAKLFDYYYEVIGGQWYGSTWDKSKLLSY